jgi:HK97 family phage major capsid protein
MANSGMTSDSYVAACRSLGDLAAGVATGDAALIQKAQERMHTAAMSPLTGERGGFLLPEAMIEAVVRNVEAAGVADRNASIVEVPSSSGRQAKRTGGPSVFYPDFGQKPTASDAKIASIGFHVVRYSVLMICDRWMLTEALRTQLGAFISEETVYSATRATDANVFIGDGGDSYARVKGVFNNADIPAVTADAGDNSFLEVVSQFPKYLTACLGTLPDWADNESTKIYGHRSIWWSWLGNVDQHGRPLLDLVLTDKPKIMLLGYPFEHGRPSRSCRGLRADLAARGTAGCS